MKTPAGNISATPSKRLFLSIIADYDLNRSICELVDNGLDVWTRSGRTAGVIIKIELDENQQTISVEDNAGGVPKGELSFIVGPGQTGGSPTDQTIGIFGVGTKRAVVALSQDIEIRTRYRREDAYMVEFDEDWLQDEDWELPLYKVDQVKPKTTIVRLQKLRMYISKDVIESLRDHLSATYAKFLAHEGLSISLNDEPVVPRDFEGWSYPPNYQPRRYYGQIDDANGRKIEVSAIAGLSDESSPTTGEYGVYFYCNDRLVARGLKNFDVGFMKGYAGLPHPKIALTKVIISLIGDARSMPWNSSKSDISTKHEVFLALHTWLMQVVKDYAALSRIWMGEWPDKVFQYQTGSIIDVPIANFPEVKKSYLPAMPKTRPRYGDVIASKNKNLGKKKPWVTGLYEGIIAADLISKQKLEQKNRISLIVLDSTIEIAFKEYLVHDSGHYYTESRLYDIFSNRHKVQTEIKKYQHFDVDIWKRISHFSDLRNKLIHQRASASISDNELENFREVVELVLKQLYGIRFH